MKRILNTILFVLVSIAAMADAIGSWTFYQSYGKIDAICPTNGNEVFVLANTALYSYNTSDNSLTEYFKGEPLNHNEIRTIAWSQRAQRLLVVYTDNNMDVLDARGNVLPISGYTDKVSSLDKTINKIFIQGATAFVFTNFGYLTIDLGEAYITDYCNIGTAFTDGVVHNNSVIALTLNGIYRGNLSENLKEKKNWRAISKSIPLNIGVINGSVVTISQGVCNRLDTATGEETKVCSPWYDYCTMANDHYVGFASNGMELFIIDEKLQMQYINFMDQHTLTCLTYDPKRRCYWGNDKEGRLTRFEIEETDHLVAKSLGVAPDGPLTNHSVRVSMHKGTLYVLPGYYDGYNQLDRPGNVFMFKNGSWSYLQNDMQTTLGLRYQDVMCVAVDPRDEGHVFVGGHIGIFEFRNGKFVRSYRYGDEGVPLISSKDNKPHWTVVLAMNFDKSGNLWVFNGSNKNIICLTASGEWKTYNHASAFGNDDLEFPYRSIIDSRGLIWFVDHSGVSSALCCYNPAKNTLKRYSKLVNQDGTGYSTIFNCVAEDKQGNIWVGTQAGPFYLDASDIAKGNDTFTQYKVARNDGTNLADYLLTGVGINAIYVDAANRKWFATDGYGAYLVSSDNNLELQHLTSENSQLLDDNVFDITIDESDGRVYMATDKGLCSYMGDVTEQNVSMDDDTVWAYPNPVTPEHTGMITIVGLEPGSDIKIISASGALVASGTAVSGSFQWNGCNGSGHRVASGMYMVHATRPDGSSGIVTKIAIVR